MGSYIFCDEAGYTGDNLLDKAQPIFVYSAVNIDPEHAKIIIEKAKKDFKIKADEFKGGKLLGRVGGNKALRYIEEECLDKSSIFCANKTYALATKLFEYVFEPLISDNSYAFYESGFHRFVSTGLYLSFVAKAENAENLLEEFCKLCISGDPDELRIFLRRTNANHVDEFPGWVLKLANIHRDKILRELRYPELKGRKLWYLELSTTALFNLLAHWGDASKELRVFCDTSKPVFAHLDMFDAMLGRKDRHYITIEGVRHPVTFNLERPIELVDSKNSHGIQIADCIASSFCNSLKMGEKIEEKVARLRYINCMFPDTSWFDVHQPKCIFNSMILQSLMEKSENGVPVLQDIEKDFFIAEMATRRYLLAHKN